MKRVKFSLIALAGIMGVAGAFATQRGTTATGKFAAQTGMVSGQAVYFLTENITGQIFEQDYECNADLTVCTVTLVNNPTIKTDGLGRSYVFVSEAAPVETSGTYVPIP